MKKVIALLVSIIMITSMVTPAFASNSPSRPKGGGTVIIHSGDPEHGPGVVIKSDPELIDDYLKHGETGGGEKKTGTKGKKITKKSGICIFRYTRPDGIEAVLVLTPYDERDTIIYDKSRRELSEAHAEIEEAEGRLDTLNIGVRQKAKEAGTTVEECYVSEIFDLTYYLVVGDYIQSDDHGSFEVTVGRDKLKNFVCLLHRFEGEWRVVQDAKVVGENEDKLSFSTEFFSPFAVVVWGDELGSDISPKTGDNSFTFAAYAAGIILSMAAVGYVLIKGRKKV